MKWARTLSMAIALFPFLMLTGVPANSAEYEEIIPPQSTSDPEKIEVVELFWYRCPHCYRLLPFMERWEKSKPDNVNYVRVPAILRGDWALHARAYYVAETLGIVEKIHRPLFDAIHAERRNLNSEKALEAFFVEQGVSAEEFRKAWRSFAVETKVRKARVMTQRYGISGTPAVVINGKYRTDGVMTGNFPNMIRVIDELIARESAQGAS
ncbi:MAG: thiol:disulfide interchange protein DsbA/DsbL [Gammaproteobacteria bacterium]